MVTGRVKVKMGPILKRTLESNTKHWHTGVGCPDPFPNTCTFAVSKETKNYPSPAGWTKNASAKGSNLEVSTILLCYHALSLYGYWYFKLLNFTVTLDPLATCNLQIL